MQNYINLLNRLIQEKDKKSETSTPNVTVMGTHTSINVEDVRFNIS